MDLKKKYGTDPALEQDGVDLHLGGDAYITVARAGGANARYEREVQRTLRPHARKMQAGTLSEDDAREMLQRVYAKTVVLGWRGVQIDGADLPFSEANCLRLFKDVPEVWSIVQDEATRLGNYQAQEVEDRGKGSGTTSSGKSNGEVTAKS